MYIYLSTFIHKDESTHKNEKVYIYIYIYIYIWVIYRFWDNKSIKIGSIFCSNIWDDAWYFFSPREFGLLWI